MDTKDVIEIQFDDKPMGVTIRVNTQVGCIFRICQVPPELVMNPDGSTKEFIDIAYPKLAKPIQIHKESPDDTILGRFPNGSQILTTRAEFDRMNEELKNKDDVQQK